MNIQEFFNKNYTNTGVVEVVNCEVNTGNELTKTTLWANRRNGDDLWTVTLELYERTHVASDNWVSEVTSLMCVNDDELINLVANFATLHYDEYFPLCLLVADDPEDDEDWDEDLAKFFDDICLSDELECDLTHCAYNNGGICRYADVFDENPIVAEDGCHNFCLKN
jgi:hypothetical protein